MATVLQPPFPGQKRKFGVLIKFKPEEECRADLEDLLAQGVSNGSVMNDENEDEDTRFESMVYGSAAEDTLTSLFRTRPSFRSKDETRRTLNGTTKTFKGESGSDAITKDALLEKMLKWLRERWRGESRRYFETDCIEGHPDMDPGMKYVHTLLREYTTGYVETGEETSWPVVQEARYVPSLADVPTEFVTDVGIAWELHPEPSNSCKLLICRVCYTDTPSTAMLTCSKARTTSIRFGTTQRKTMFLTVKDSGLLPKSTVRSTIRLCTGRSASMPADSLVVSL